eukprot:COSAG05_NODE_1546_length_4588_cov_3.851637_2_plen_93_part_00
MGTDRLDGGAEGDQGGVGGFRTGLGGESIAYSHSVVSFPMWAESSTDEDDDEEEEEEEAGGRGEDGYSVRSHDLPRSVFIPFFSSKSCTAEI